MSDDNSHFILQNMYKNKCSTVGTESCTTSGPDPEEGRGRRPDGDSCIQQRQGESHNQQEKSKENGGKEGEQEEQEYQESGQG